MVVEKSSFLLADVVYDSSRKWLWLQRGDAANTSLTCYNVADGQCESISKCENIMVRLFSLLFGRPLICVLSLPVLLFSFFFLVTVNPFLDFYLFFDFDFIFLVAKFTFALVRAYSPHRYSTKPMTSTLNCLIQAIPRNRIPSSSWKMLSHA